MRALKFLVPLLAIVFIAGACRGSDVGDAPPTTTPPSVTQPPTDTPPTSPPTTNPPDTEPTTTTTTIAVSPVSYLANGTPAVYQIWNATKDVIVKDNPGSTGDTVLRFTPSARDIKTTGRQAEVDNERWFEVELPSDETGWVLAKYLVHQITELDSHRPARFVIAGLGPNDALNVREDPGVDHAVLTTFATNTTVKTTGDRAQVQGSVWAEIEYATGKTGWVNASYLAPEVIVLKDDTPDTYQVTGIQGSERLNVRKGPGVHQAVISTLAADATGIESTGNRAEVAGSVWREIKLADGKVGWVNASFLEVQPEPPAPVCRPGGDTFCPNVEVTRGMAAAFLTRALGLTDDGGKDWFTDDNGTTYETEINRLAAAGILRGCDAGNTSLVCPNEPAPRAIVAALFSRALGLTDDGGKDWFTDDNGTTYETEINRLAAAGVVRSCEADTAKFCPTKPIVRGQMAAWLVRAFDVPATTQDYWSDDNGSTFEADINAITAAGIARQ